MVTALFCITFLYLLIVGLLVYGFDRVNEFYLSDTKPNISFSVIVPFRNEANNLPMLLKTVLQLNYPKSHFEIILIDDDSTDDSVALIEKQFSNTKVNFRILKNLITSGSPKKDAITIGVTNAKNEWIVTTDADCQLPKYWLDVYNDFILKNNPALVVAPLTLISARTFLDRFQALDVLSLQGATIGTFGINKPILCNGANLAYKRSVFIELDGYNDNNSIASGDDIFLLQKVLKLNPKAVHYLKNYKAMVQSNSQPSRKTLLAQRVRWASKTKGYKSLFSKLVALIVFLMNLAILATFVFVVIGEFNPMTWLYAFIIKVALDFLLIFKTARQFNQESILFSFVSSSLVYPLFVFIVGVLSAFGGYKWKDRQFKR